MKKYLIPVVFLLLACGCGRGESDADAWGTFEAEEVIISAEIIGQDRHDECHRGQ